MKNEEKIIELLAEYLLKTDRLLDRMEKTDRNVDTMSRTIAEHSLKFNSMNEKFNNEIIDIRQQQSVMLKELISISKRVSIVEDKQNQ